MQSKLQTLLEKLDNNYYATIQLEQRYESAKTLQYYIIFNKSQERKEKLEWILKVRRRVLKMRHRLLYNIQSETNKEFYNTSNLLRNIA